MSREVIDGVVLTLHRVAFAQEAEAIRLVDNVNREKRFEAGQSAGVATLVFRNDACRTGNEWWDAEKALTRVLENTWSDFPGRGAGKRGQYVANLVRTWRVGDPEILPCVTIGVKGDVTDE